MNNSKIVYLEKVIEEQYPNTAGIVIMKNEKLVYEQYFNGLTKDDTIHIASVTKSIISTLIGIAIDQGYIKSVNQKVLDFFPDYIVKRGEKMIQNVTIQNLLTMTAPYKYKSEPYTKVYSSDDWTKAALDLLGGKSEIGPFRYSTVGTQILSGILTSATGDSVLDFAKENLFEPLEIRVPHKMIIRNKDEYFAFLKDKYVSGWIVDPRGVNTAGWGLTLTPRDMVKIGQLYLNGGMWEGKQILSSKWIEESSRENSRCGKLSYGYLWWIIDGDNCCYAALGDGGNIIFVNPEKKMVVVMTACFMPRAKDRIELIKKHIELVFEDNK
ncbi:serine hydrolase domain-containing protein [Caldalkalibacillus mannanilyticus]|uniref:serine hydrolase domain-containing protein n=1 Tax=Caldalkalibacillus mannanilyticus TaxID=1418 RepID=UPI0004698125|nr:serine hydrolase [Caldalkalibacillus mannanilyticus]